MRMNSASRPFPGGFPPREFDEPRTEGLDTTCVPASQESHTGSYQKVMLRVFIVLRSQYVDGIFVCPYITPRPTKAHSIIQGANITSDP
jgi:hypothetical protein